MLFGSIIPEMFSLDSEELQLVQANNTEKNRLAFAIMLKFLQINGRYPTKKDTIEPVMLFSLAHQLKVSAHLFEPIHLENRTAERFRQKIREFLGYKVATLPDAEKLITCLIEQAGKGPYTMSQYREKAHQFHKEQKIEPFSPKKIDRYVRSAIARFEKQFFVNITKQLSPDAVKLFKKLLRDDKDADDTKIEPDANTEVTLRRLKADPSGVKLKHVAFEIKKLSLIRSVPIPAQLFGDASRKLIKKYYQRIMAASPSNILEFVPNARMASMACFLGG